MTQVFQKDGTVVPVTLIDIDKTDKLKVSNKVKITGISKGKGFQGVVKRWGFKGSKKTHGQKHTLRAPGSIGQIGVAKVFKGKKMPGRMGNKKVSLKQREIIKINKTKKQIAIKGAIPGPRKSRIEIYEN